MKKTPRMKPYRRRCLQTKKRRIPCGAVVSSEIVKKRASPPMREGAFAMDKKGKEKCCLTGWEAAPLQKNEIVIFIIGIFLQIVKPFDGRQDTGLRQEERKRKNKGDS